MDAQTFAAYTAGFYDGEGWVVIGVERSKKETRSDNHHIGIYITQRSRYRTPLDRIQAVYGGVVTTRDLQLKKRPEWSEQSDWHIHTREQIKRFCEEVMPYCLVKGPQLAIALEFVTDFQIAPNVRDELGRIHGRSLTAEEVDRRERLRLALKVVNAKDPGHMTQIIRESPRARNVERPKVPPAANPRSVSRGEHRYNSVLTEDAVRSIRATHTEGGKTLEAMALQYGVSPAAIRQVLRGLSWKHVT